MNKIRKMQTAAGGPLYYNQDLLFITPSFTGKTLDLIAREYLIALKKYKDEQFARAAANRVEPQLTSDNRSTWERLQGQQKAREVLLQELEVKNQEAAVKAAEGLMRMASPSTYVGLAMGNTQGTGTGNMGLDFLIDAGVFGGPSLIRGGLGYLASNSYRYSLGRPQVPKNFLTIKPQIRTKVGDVEIDNPGLYYHLSDAGKARHFVETGRMRTPLEESWLAREEAGERIPLAIRSGARPGYPQDPGNAMFAQGGLWYGLTSNKPDLLVTAREMPIANKNASIMSDKASLRMLEAQGTRRVTNDNIYTQGPHNRKNTTAYTWEPGYGYRRIFTEESPVAEWTRTPYITALNATRITPEQWTAAQDVAIARGDMAEAQRLRDLHFKVSAPNTKVVDGMGNPQLVIHKTPNDFTVFDNSRSVGNLNWAATPKAFEGENGVFATGAGTNPKEMRLYVNMKNPHYPTIDEGMEPAFINEGEDGILGIIDKDRTDLYKSALDAGEGFNMSLGVDNPYALKSANAVTYDNNGVRIPLGKRDNFKLNDIRYSWLPLFLGGSTAATLYNNQQ